MSFPKARVKRFNEISSCAPPVGHYDPKTTESVNVPSLDTKDERFKEPKEVIKMRSSSLGSRNGKTVSNSSSVESLPKSICFTTHSSIKHTNKEKDLNKQLRQTVKERNSFYQKMVRKTEELSEAERQLELVLEEKLKIEEEAESLREEMVRLERDWASRERDQDLNSEIKDHFQWKIGTLEQNIKGLSLSMDREHQSKLNLEKEMNSLKEELAFLKAIIGSKDTKILNLQLLLTDSERDAAEERSKVARLRSELVYVETQLQKLEILAVAQDSKTIVLERSLDEREDDLRKSEERAEALVKESKIKTKELIEEHSNRLSFERNLVSELEEKLIRKEGILDELTKKINDAENYKQTLVSLKESHALEISSKEAQILDLVRVVRTSDEGKSTLMEKLEKLEMESKIMKLDLEKELSKKDDQLRELENQLNMEKRRYLLLEGQLSKEQVESVTTVEILTRKLKESDRIHQTDFSRIGQLEGEVAELRKALAGRESAVWKLQEEVDSMRCSEEETRRSFEDDCSFLLRQIDECKAKLESADLEHRKVVNLLMSSRSEHEAKTCELTRALETSVGEVKRIMKDHIELSKEHQKVIFDFQELRASQESSTKDIKNFYQEELKRSHVEAENKMAKLKEECQRWKMLYEEQSEKIEPFKELLEKYELEKQVLQNRNESVQKEVDKLNGKYAEMFGHQNHKQKIQHLAKLKKENITLKEEIAKLQAKDTMNRKRIEKLTGQLETLEGKKRFDPLTAFGLNRNHGGDEDEGSERRVTYDVGRPASANLHPFPATRPR